MEVSVVLWYIGCAQVLSVPYCEITSVSLTRRVFVCLLVDYSLVVYCSLLYCICKPLKEYSIELPTVHLYLIHISLLDIEFIDSLAPLS